MKKSDWELFEIELNKEIDVILGLPEEQNRLKEYFERYRKAEGIQKYQKLDEEIFKKMYNRVPSKTEVTKIRYWRCGRHLPINRDEMISLGAALNMSEEEIHLILTEVMLEQGLKIKRNQKELLNSLAKRYLALIPPERKKELGIKGQNVDGYLRHILYADIMDCLWNNEMDRSWYREKHDYSRNFASECSRFFQTEDKIGRSTMQRLLLIMLIPEMNREIMDDALISLGYAPLSGKIKKKSGAYTDRLYIWLLSKFEQHRTGDMSKDLEIQKQMMCYLDEQVVRRLMDVKTSSTIFNKNKIVKKLQDLRIMKFRSFGKELK